MTMMCCNIALNQRFWDGSATDVSPLFGLECHALPFREQESMMAWDLAL